MHGGYPSGKRAIDWSIDQTGRLAASEGSATVELGRSKVRGRSLASSSSSSRSVVETLTQEKRSSEEKKAEARVAPSHEASWSILLPLLSSI